MVLGSTVRFVVEIISTRVFNCCTDLLREETGEPYKEGETKLPRTKLDMQG